MKKPGLLALLVVWLISGASFGQNSNKELKMEQVNPLSIAIDQTSAKALEPYPHVKNGGENYGFDASPNIGQNGDKPESHRYIFLAPNNLTYKFSEY